jgi:hypothetical protein
MRLHGADGHVADGPIRRRRTHQPLTLQVRFQQLERGIGQEFAVRDAAQQLQALLAKPLAQHLDQLRPGVHVHLVHHGAQHPHALALEQRVVQHDLVDGAPDASLADDDHRRVQQLRHACVGQPDDGAHPGVPRPLHQHHVAVRCHALVRIQHLGRKVLADAAHDVVGGEVAGQRDRAHIVQRIAQVEDRLHQDRVLVRARPIHHDVALADGLEEAQPMAAGHDGRR